MAPENTLSAARLAHEIGAHRWETDVGLTGDGQLVLFHDATLTRCTNAPEVFEYDPDLQEQNLGPGGFGQSIDRLDSYILLELEMLDAGSYFEQTDPFSTVGTIESDTLVGYKGESIPSLYDGIVLTRDLGWKINIELKDHNNEPQLYHIASQTLANLARAGMSHHNVVISSFNHGWLRWIRDRAPDIEIQALVGYHDDEPLNFASPLFTNEEFPVLNINAKLVTPKDIRELKARGKRVNLFTVNDPHDYMRFVNAGADGIITDFPQRFIR